MNVAWKLTWNLAQMFYQFSKVTSRVNNHYVALEFHNFDVISRQLVFKISPWLTTSLQEDFFWSQTTNLLEFEQKAPITP